MNKIYFSAAAFICAGFLLTGCNKDDNGLNGTNISTIDAKVENGSDYNTKIDAVKALINANEEYNSESGQYVYTGHEVASGNYTNGGFTLDLPKTVDDQYLSLLTTDGMPKEITVSDTTVKGNSIEIVAYKSGVEVGYFEYNSPDSTATSGYIYVDRNVKITGSGSEDLFGSTFKYIYNVSWKKGWNIAYFKETTTVNSYTVEVTTTEPSGLRWILKNDNQSDSYRVRSYSPAAAKAISNRKPFSLFK